MAYQPPYGYGGGSYPQPGYGYPQNNRDAMLHALAQPDNPNYSYPSGRIQGTPTQTGKANQIADTGVGLAWEGTGGAAGAGIGTATGLLADKLKPQGQAATASPYADLTDQYTRRMEGSGEGIAGGATKWGGRGAQLGLEVGGPVGAGIGGAVGAVAGAIGNAFTKNAKSAYSDFRTQDAVEAIKKMYQTRGGRLPTEQDIETILIGQGMDAADARQHTGYVGEKGLYSVLNSLDKNFAAERQRLVDQAGGGTTPSGTGAAPTTPQPVAQLAGTGGNGGTFPQGQSPGPAGMAGRPAGAIPQNAAPGATPISENLPGAGGPPSGIPPSTPTPQTPAPPVVPDASQAPPATAPAPTLPANADTDGYAAPAYTVKPTGPPPPGWDGKKWTDESHQTPKYVVGRILAQFAPTSQNMPQVLAEIQKAYPGTTLIGKDTINIPGVGKTDILRGADVGGKGWQWLGEHAQQAGAKGGGGDTSGAGYNAGGDVAGANVIAQIIASLSGQAGGQMNGPVSSRDALLAQLGIR
jgi:hypothetical protein